MDACGVCGSDLHGFLGTSARRNQNLPLVMGREITGRVVAHGSGVTRVEIQLGITCGVCPACRSGRANICPFIETIGIERAGAFTSLVAVPVDRAFVVPDALSVQAAAMVQTLAIEVRLFREFVPSLVRCIVILGAGITRQQALASLAPNGSAMLVGLGEGSTVVDILPVINREQTIQDVYCFSDDEFMRSIELLASGQIQVDDMVVELPLAEGIRIFEGTTRLDGDVVKVLLRPDAVAR